MATITIAYTAPVAPQVTRVADICATYQPVNAACDLPPFKDTYYDTNVDDKGMNVYGSDPFTALEKYMAGQVAHPGVVAALRAAMSEGEFVIEFPTEDDILYYTELKPALVDQGFEITIDGGSGSEG